MEKHYKNGFAFVFFFNKEKLSKPPHLYQCSNEPSNFSPLNSKLELEVHYQLQRQQHLLRLKEFQQQLFRFHELIQLQI